jgi:hypothetical protein
MSSRLAALAAALLLLAAAAPPAGRAYLAAVRQWRQEREAGLRQPDGWFSLAGLYWLRPGANSFGAAAGSRLRFPAGRAPAHAGDFLFEDGRVTVRVRPGVSVTAAGRPVRTLALHADTDSTGPTVLALGSLRFHVIRRGEHVGVRLKDLESPSRQAFRGVPCYPVDPAWRIAARFERYDPPRHLPITNVLGDVSPSTCPGAAVFTRGGRTWRLDAIRELGDDQLFFIFGDRTNGRGTYGAGRFLYTPLPRDGKVDLDFNKAENPPCAFTPYATCPLPPAQNRLALSVEAGEKEYRGAGAHR